jgi:hypothetical protein
MRIERTSAIENHPKKRRSIMFKGSTLTSMLYVVFAFVLIITVLLGLSPT